MRGFDAKIVLNRFNKSYTANRDRFRPANCLEQREPFHAWCKSLTGWLAIQRLEPLERLEILEPLVTCLLAWTIRTGFARTWTVEPL